MKTPILPYAISLTLALGALNAVYADSATWSLNPTTGDWNTAANWTPATVPNSTTDVATFGASNVTNLTITNASVNLDSAVFNRGAPPYTLTIQIYNLIFYGAGIVNNSGSVLSIVTPTVDDNDAAMFFYNSATAGNMTNYSTVGGLITFYDFSSAGSATFDLTSGSLQADVDFNDDSTAGNATINASGSSVIEFFDSSTGGNATLNLSTAAFVTFAGSNNAEHMTATCIGGEGQFSSQMDFEGFSSAGEGTFTTIGGSTTGEEGAFILFDNTATADNATFAIGGRWSGRTRCRWFHRRFLSSWGRNGQKLTLDPSGEMRTSNGVSSKIIFRRVGWVLFSEGDLSELVGIGTPFPQMKGALILRQTPVFPYPPRQFAGTRAARLTGIRPAAHSGLTFLFGG